MERPASKEPHEEPVSGLQHEEKPDISASDGTRDQLQVRSGPQGHSESLERKRRRVSIGDGDEERRERSIRILEQSLFSRILQGIEQRVDQLIDQKIARGYLQQTQPRTDMLEARLEQRLEQLSTTLEQAEEGHLTGARPGASSDEGIRESVQHRVIQPVKENEYTAFLATHVQTREPNSNWTAVTAKSFFRSISSFNRDFILEDASPRLEPWARRRTRVAIIDSGIISCENKQHLRKLDPMICAAGERIINRRSWVGVESDCNDECGHGTHVVRQLLEVAPRAELVIAKVASNTENIPLSYVAKAIEWAVDDNDVDIVALSLGVSQDDKHINTVLDRILNLDGKQTGQVSNGVKGHRRRIVFAAAGNHGGNRMRASPARRRGVICVHAADGEGDTKSFNPDPDHEWEDNFSTLGVDIVSLRQGESVYISGTSYATPIAAGIAANMLHFARNQPGMREEDKNLLHSYFGMRQIFKRISFPRGNYDYICPWRRKDRMANQPDEATDMSLSELLWSSIGVAREEARKAEAL